MVVTRAQVMSPNCYRKPTSTTTDRGYKLSRFPVGRNHLVTRESLQKRREKIEVFFLDADVLWNNTCKFYLWLIFSVRNGCCLVRRFLVIKLFLVLVLALIAGCSGKSGGLSKRGEEEMASHIEELACRPVKYDFTSAEEAPGYSDGEQ